MAKTVIGMFRDTREAHEAVRQLISSGVSREDIGITSNDYGTEGTAAASERGAVARSGEGVGESISNFFKSLFGGNDSNQARYYSDAVSRGGAVVTVDTDSDEIADRAASILDRYGADVDDGGAHYDTSTADYAASNATMTGGTANATSNAAYASGEEGRRDRAAYAGEAQTLPVIEEELRIGKREVERGGVRVRSHVVERPVEEVVRLREERVRVERRPVNRLVTDADLQAFREGTIEITERAEEAVIDKRARVIEEIVVGKEVGERTETVRDTLRRTDVEVEELRPDTERDTRAKGTGR